MVTIRDLLEQLVGEIQQEGELPEIQPLEEGTWRIQGSAPLDDVARTLGVDLPLEEYDTFGGYVFGLYGSVPQDGGSCGRGMWSAVRLRALVFWKTLWKDNRNQTASGLAPLAVSLVSQETLLPQGRGTNPGPAGRPVSAPVGSVSPPSPSGGR